MKRKNREQIVPLSTQAVALFKRAIELNNGSPTCSPPTHRALASARRPATPHIHGESVSRAMARLRERVGLDDARVHDLRKTVTTWLREHKAGQLRRVRLDPAPRAQGRDGEPLRLQHAGGASAGCTADLGGPRREDCGERSKKATRQRSSNSAPNNRRCTTRTCRIALPCFGAESFTLLKRWTNRQHPTDIPCPTWPWLHLIRQPQTELGPFFVRVIGERTTSSVIRNQSRPETLSQ